MRNPTRPGVSVDVQVGTELKLDDGRIRIIVEKKEGRFARLRVIADKSVIVNRGMPKNVAQTLGWSNIHTAAEVA
jgi:pyruvate kinase